MRLAADALAAHEVAVRVERAAKPLECLEVVRSRIRGLSGRRELLLLLLRAASPAAREAPARERERGRPDGARVVLPVRRLRAARGCLVLDARWRDRRRHVRGPCDTPVRLAAQAHQVLELGLEQREHRAQQRLEERREERLLRGEQALDAVALLGGFKTCWARLRDDWQPDRLREGLGLVLAHVRERPDDPQVLCVDRIVCLHRAECAVVHGRHEEGLCEIVKMLRHGEHIVPLAPRGRVEDATLHARAERANGHAVAFFGHARLGNLEQRVLLVKIGQPELGAVGDEGRRVETVGSRVHGAGSQIPLEGGALLERMQDV